MDRKKIVYIADFVPHYHVNLHKTLELKFNKNNHDYHLISIKNPPKEGRTGVLGKVIDKHFFYEKEYKIFVGPYRFYWQKNLLTILKDINPDVIIIPGHLGNVTAWVITRKYKNMVFSWMCGYEYVSSSVKTFLQKQNLKTYFHHFAYSTYAKKYITKHGIEDEKVTIMHNTIDQSLLKVVSKDEANKYIFDKHDVNDSQKVLLYVGTLLNEKNVNILVDAMQYLDESYTLFIIGDGPAKKGLEEEAEKSDNIIFTGNLIEDKHYYFTKADIFLMPGTGGLALNEALYYGNVLFSALGDGSAEDLVIEGYNGKRIDDLQGKELSLILDDMYKSNDIIEYKKNSQEIKEKFSFDAYTDIIVNTTKKISEC